MLGIIGVPAPQLCLVVNTCKASWAQARGWGWGVVCRAEGTNTQHRGRGGGGGAKAAPLVSRSPTGASLGPAPSLCGS